MEKDLPPEIEAEAGGRDDPDARGIPPAGSRMGTWSGHVPDRGSGNGQRGLLPRSDPGALF